MEVRSYPLFAHDGKKLHLGFELAESLPVAHEDPRRDPLHEAEDDTCVPRLQFEYGLGAIANSQSVIQQLQMRLVRAPLARNPRNKHSLQEAKKTQLSLRL